jgi:glycosyltransferase involved in cell wall biosynthesis
MVVALRSSPRDLEPEFRASGIEIHTLDLAASGKRRFGQLVTKIFDLCRQYRPDAFLSMPLGWHAFMALGARLAGVQATAAHVGNYPNHLSGSFSKFRWQVQAGRLVTRKLICCSSYVQSGVVEYLRLPTTETEVIYNGVDVDSISRRSTTVRASSGSRGPFVAGMVARFEVHKDQPTLIRAAKLLADAGHHLEVWLIGDGSRRAEYEALVRELGLSEVVKILGMRRDVPELLARLDAFVFAATPDEGLGVALVEAMVAGTPIVATDVGACREVLDSGALGTLVPAGRPQALADAIDRLIRDPIATREQTEKGRQKALEVFSIDSMATRYARTLGLLESAA